MSVTAVSAPADERVGRLRAVARAAGIDAFLATRDQSIAYLSGFRSLQLERLFAVVVRAHAATIVVPRLDLGQVAGAPAVLERVSYEASSDRLPELVRALGDARRIGVEEDHLIFGRAEALRTRGLDLVPGSGVIATLRWRKDSAEIEKVRAPCELVERALVQMFDGLRPRAVEREVNAQVENWLRQRGAAAAHPLILFGENSANPHGEPGSRELRGGDGGVRRFVRLRGWVLGRSHPVRDGWEGVRLGARSLGACERGPEGGDRCPPGRSPSARGRRRPAGPGRIATGSRQLSARRRARDRARRA